MITLREPSHLTFVRQYLNWERVQKRLGLYKHIGEVFPMESLQKCSDKSPYFCHYLSWRLGTWQDEGLFEFLDRLLEIGTNLSGWNKTRLPGGCEFDSFWGFIWELQVAAFFADQLGLKTEWLKTGPDFRVVVESSELFVECTTYRKSFALEEFIKEIFHSINPQIIAKHVPCMQFSLPKNKNIEGFLDDLFEPYLDPTFLPGKLKELEELSPLVLPVPSEDTRNFYVYLENHDAVNHNAELEQILTSAGDPTVFWDLSLKEILSNKKSKNRLGQHQPNLLMVNFLLGTDWQLARKLIPIPELNLCEPFGGILFTACGIDRLPAFQNSYIAYKKGHPIESLIESQRNK
ncbi:MAG: hypothetical protein HPY59_03715 [Anaerolineae bacterium]|nr:hypothetical protein [Anaerolineae bacterium]